MDALRGLTLLLLLQTAGEALVHSLRWPVPGPVVAMVLLAALMAFEPLRGPVAAAAQWLLSHLSLLFVPVGVGVITHLDLLARAALPLLAAVVVSTWVGMAVTALVLQRLLPAGGAETQDGHA